MTRAVTRLTRRLDDAFRIEDVGASLLENLAKGLYLPHEVIREYVQNAVDAHRLWSNATGAEPEGPVQVEINRDRLRVYDYGIGMDEEEIRKVKSIAVSRKGRAEVRLTGHKGVGVWAGLSYFRRFTIESTKRGVPLKFTLDIDFAKIVELINSADSDTLNIGDVLNPNYVIEEEPHDEGEHYTIVTLHSPTRSPEFFLEPEKIADAIRRTCPCELDPTHHLTAEISSWYEENNLETFAIDLAGERVYRSFPGTVEDFKTGLVTLNDAEVARYWLAVNTENRVLTTPGRDDQFVGFRLFQDGFAIGDGNTYSERDLAGFPTLRPANYLDWYIGEVHVTAAGLRPNLRRDRFEESEDSRLFVGRLRRWYQDLADETRVLSEVRGRLKACRGLEAELEPLLARDRLVPLQASEVARVEEIRRELTASEQPAPRNRSGTDTIGTPKERDVRLLRRQLLTRIAAKFPDAAQAVEVPAIPEPATSPDPGAPRAEEVTPAQNASAAIGAGTRSPTALAQTAEAATSNGTAGAAKTVKLFLTMLEEVLAEEVPVAATRESILRKLRQRIEQVMVDA